MTRLRFIAFKENKWGMWNRLGLWMFFSFLCQVFIGELYRWGSSSAFEGMKRFTFGAYDIRATLDGLHIEALSDERYRIEF